MPVNKDTVFGVPGDDFEATLVFDSYSYSSLSPGNRKKTMWYYDPNTDHYFRLANATIENLVRRNQLSPVITAFWSWSSQGGTPVLKALHVTYAGIAFPQD